MDNDMANNDRQTGVNNTSNAKLLVDSGVHKTPLTEEQGERLWSERMSNILTRVVKLEGLGNHREFRRTGESGTAERSLAPSCNTCTRPTHGIMACPGKKVRCYGYGLMGH